MVAGGIPCDPSLLQEALRCAAGSLPPRVLALTLWAATQGRGMEAWWARAGEGARNELGAAAEKIAGFCASTNAPAIAPLVLAELVESLLALGVRGMETVVPRLTAGVAWWMDGCLPSGGGASPLATSLWMRRIIGPMTRALHPWGSLPAGALCPPWGREACTPSTPEVPGSGPSDLGRGARLSSAEEEPSLIRQSEILFRATKLVANEEGTGVSTRDREWLLRLGCERLRGGVWLPEGIVEGALEALGFAADERSPWQVQIARLLRCFSMNPTWW